MKRLADNLSRARLHAELVRADGRTWRPEAQVDAVLLDAPCSATGTIRRHPELPWIRGPEAIERNAANAAALLDSAWTWLKPGGHLVFAVCSLEPEEGEDQIARFCARTPGARAVAIDPATYGLDGTPGHLRLFPSMLADQGGLDGFFVAALRKA